jgi:hypothetical protein
MKIAKAIKAQMKRQSPAEQKIAADARARAMAAHPAGKGLPEAPRRAQHRHATGNPHKLTSDHAPKHVRLDP